jgi:hypothetical protein
LPGNSRSRQAISAEYAAGSAKASRPNRTWVRSTSRPQCAKIHFPSRRGGSTKPIDFAACRMPNRSTGEPCSGRIHI